MATITPKDDPASGSLSEKTSDQLGEAERYASTSLEEKAKLLGATPDEVLEAEEQGRALSIEETKEVLSPALTCTCQLLA